MQYLQLFDVNRWVNCIHCIAFLRTVLWKDVDSLDIINCIAFIYA